MKSQKIFCAVPMYAGKYIAITFKDDLGLGHTLSPPALSTVLCLEVCSVESIYIIYFKTIGWVHRLLCRPAFDLHHIMAIYLQDLTDYLAVGSIYNMYPLKLSLISLNSCKNLPCSQRVKQSSGVPHYKLNDSAHYFTLLFIRIK